MSPSPPPSGTVLCRLDDIPETGLAVHGLALVRRGDVVTAFVNACAHFGVALNARPDSGFVDLKTGQLVCHVHYARYAAEDGRCLRGECDGEGLRQVAVTVRDGVVVVG